MRDFSLVSCIMLLDHPPQYNGYNILVHNNAFSYNDWAGHGNLGTVMDKSQGGEFSQNTLYYNGPAHGLRYWGGTPTSPSTTWRGNAGV